MAAISRSVVCQQRAQRNDRQSRITHLRRWLASVAFRRSVSRCGGRMASWQKSIRLTARPKHWWRRLNKALGTTSSDFVNASLFQIQASCPFTFGRNFRTLHECCARYDRSRSAQDEIEAALAVQMAATHTAAMARSRQDGRRLRNRAANSRPSDRQRLAERRRTSSTWVLRKPSSNVGNGGQQFVRVEHVHVNDGGQAVIGNVKKPDVRG